MRCTAAVLGCIIAAGAVWWLCQKDPNIPYLPERRGASWILHPKLIAGGRLPARPVVSVFERKFFLDSPPPEARLRLCAFKSASVRLNGTEITLPKTPEQEWKAGLRIVLRDLLKPGTNMIQVSVTNHLGPPALWLRLETDGLCYGTDGSWSTRSGNTEPRSARVASLPPEISPATPFYGGETLGSSLERLWPLLAALSVFLSAVILLSRCLPANWRTARIGITILIASVVLIRTVLYLNNGPLLAREVGFDAKAHEEYVGFILERGALPLPSDGWEMHQAPLFYSVGALVLKLARLSIAQDTATLALRGLNSAAGLLHCWLVLVCLRRLFPGDLQSQAAGFILAAFLPCHLYLAQYVTNDIFAGLLVSLATYCFLCAEEGKPKYFILAGTALGAALLTKLYALVAIPVFLVCAFFRSAPAPDGEKSFSSEAKTDPHQEAHSFSLGFLPWRHRLPALAWILLPCSLVSGWNFLRVWTSQGQPILGNWEQVSNFAWWQDPGYRSIGFYSHFGRSFVTPVFSAFYSFGDGIYSTLWADGLVGGAGQLAFRPPWNYDWMNAGCLLGLGLSAVILLGLALELGRAVASVCCRRLLLTGLLLAYVAGIGWISLRVPSSASVKAFYGLPAMVPLCVIFAAGWRWLAAKHRLIQAGLWILLLLWATTVVGTFFVHRNNPQTEFLKGFETIAVDQAEAKRRLARALLLDGTGTNQISTGWLASSRAIAHFALATIEDREGHATTARRLYRASVNADENSTATLNNVAWVMATSPNAALRDGAEAVRLAERACFLSRKEITSYVGTLAAAYAEAGRMKDAVTTARTAIELATLRGENDVANRNRELLEFYVAGKAWHESSQVGTSRK